MNEKMVRAKFICIEKKDVFDIYNKSKSNVVVLAPAFGDENKDWSQWTPAGRIEMTINNPAALDTFVLGKAYFVDFTPAE